MATDRDTGTAVRACIDCPKYIYKGDDEQYCQAARMRPFVLKRWQRVPKWCPFEKQKRFAEWQKRKEMQDAGNS